MKRNGMIRKNGELVRAEIGYNDPDYCKFSSHGEPISIRGAIGLIKNFWDHVKAGKPIDYKDKPAFTFGKEAMLSILAQDNCEGVRIYFAMKSDTDWAESNSATRPECWKNGVTMLAVGIKKNGEEVGAPVDYIIREIDKPLLDDEVNFLYSNPGDARETVPPSPTYGITPGILEIVDEYLKKETLAEA